MICTAKNCYYALISKELNIRAVYLKDFKTLRITRNDELIELSSLNKKKAFARIRIYRDMYKKAPV